MLGASGLTVTPRPIQTRQVSVRFTEAELRRLDKAARKWDMSKGVLIQRLVIEWLDSLGQDGE